MQALVPPIFRQKTIVTALVTGRQLKRPAESDRDGRSEVPIGPVVGNPGHLLGAAKAADIRWMAAEAKCLATVMNYPHVELLSPAEARAQVLAARLAGLDPEGPLARGYSLVRIKRTGRFLRSATDVVPGDLLGVRHPAAELGFEDLDVVV